MSEIQRFRTHKGNLEIMPQRHAFPCPSNSDEVVLFSDYDALATRLAEAEAFARDTDSGRWNRMKAAENAQDDLEQKLKDLRATFTKELERHQAEATRLATAERTISDQQNIIFDMRARLRAYESTIIMRGLPKYLCAKDANEPVVMPSEESLSKILDDLQQAQAEVTRLRELIYWLLGERDAFPDPPIDEQGKPKKRYWWRKELRRRFELAQPKETPQ